MFESIQAKVIDIKALDTIRRQFPGKKIVFCTGCYDILQSGHAVFFSQCRQYGDILVVGVGRDATIQVLKGPADRSTRNRTGCTLWLPCSMSIMRF